MWEIHSTPCHVSHGLLVSSNTVEREEEYLKVHTYGNVAAVELLVLQADRGHTKEAEVVCSIARESQEVQQLKVKGESTHAPAA